MYRSPCGKIRALTKHILWQYTLVGYASYGQLKSCGKIIICGKIRALTKHILWQCTLVDYASYGRLRSCGKIIICGKSNVPWWVTRLMAD